MLSEQAPDTDTNSEHDDDDAPPSNFQQTSEAPRSPRTRHSHQKPKRRPKVIIMGDSISKRIHGNRLLRNAEVSNLSESGRGIEQISEDITRHRSPISKADSLIIHVSTNNLQRDNLDQVKSKLRKLQDTIKSHVSPKCEVAMSSVISRKDEHAPKVGPVNDVINKMCNDNRWTYIDNSSVKDLSGDKLHPTSRGISYLARNFQDFLRCVHPYLFPRTIYPEWVTALMT